MNSGFWQIAARLGIILTLAVYPTTVAALTASAAYRQLQGLFDEQGAFFENGSVLDNGNSVVLNSVRIGAVQTNGRWEISPETVRFTEMSDGRVAIEFPEIFPIEISSLNFWRYEGNLRLSGFEALVSEIDGEVTFTTTADLVEVSYDDSNLIIGNRWRTKIAASKWESELTRGMSSEGSVRASLGAKSLEIEGIRRSAQGVAQVNLDDFRAEFVGDIGNLFSYFPDPFSDAQFSASFSAATVEGMIASANSNSGNKLNVSINSLSGRISSAPNLVDGAIAFTDLSMTSGENSSLAEDLIIENFQLSNEVSVESGLNAAQFTIDADMSGVEINNDLLSSLGEISAFLTDGEFPPAKLSFNVTLDMTEERAKTLFSTRNAEFEPPEMVDMAVSSFELGIIGASLNAVGNISFAALGPPDFNFLPTGELQTEVAGLSNVIDRLRSANMLDRETELIVRLILAAGDEIGDDRFGYEIILDENRDITVNGITF